MTHLLGHWTLHMGRSPVDMLADENGYVVHAVNPLLELTAPDP